MYQNPSAGKFDPPPAPPNPGDDRPQRRWLTLTLLVLTGYPAIHFLSKYHGRGWYAVLPPLAMFGMSVIHFVLQRKRAAELGRDEPYSRPTSITR